MVGAGVVLIIYMSLVWSVVKKDYRRHILGSGSLTSVSWLADKYVGGGVDLSKGASLLLERIGYTKFYALVLERDTERFRGIYLRAVEHVIMPRILFPNKASLNDLLQTNQVLGWKISKDTSVGLGYIAQAQIDFGFPGLLIPIFGLGTIVGLIYSYFKSRQAPVFIREAFAVACLFNALPFEGNIDKELGGMLMGFVVFALALKFAGPHLIRFVAVQPVPRIALGIRVATLQGGGSARLTRPA